MWFSDKDNCMELCRTLSSFFESKKPFVSLTGGGGKTTLMVCLAGYYRNQGKRVLMTTTTKIMSPHLHDYGADFVFGDDTILDFFPKSPCSVLYAVSNGKADRWVSPPLEHLDVLKDRYDVIINEADGSRGLPFKIHTSIDPVVPPFTTDTVSITGVWGIGHKAAEVAFGDSRDVPVDAGYLKWYINEPEGLLKSSIPDHRTVLFNGAEDFGESGILRDIDCPRDVRVLLVSEKEDRVYEYIR